MVEVSYARFSYADVYVYMDVGGYLSCCGCWLVGMEGEWAYHSTQDMIDHLAEHRAAGHNVPADIEDSLREDDEDNFPPQCAEGHDWGPTYYPYADDDNEFARMIERRKCTRCHWTD